MATVHPVSVAGYPREITTLRAWVESITDRIHAPAEQWARDHGLTVQHTPGLFGWHTRRTYRHPLFEGKPTQSVRQPIAPTTTDRKVTRDRPGLEVRR